MPRPARAPSPRPRRRPPRPAPRELADRLHSAAIHLLRRLRTEDTASGLTAPRASALSVLVFGGPQTLTGLAALEQVRAPTMSRLIQNLEREALIRRVPDPDDRRVQWIHATPEARRLLLEGRARRVDRLEGDLRRLSVGDYRALARGANVLERVARTADGQMVRQTDRHKKGSSRNSGISR